MGTDTSIDCQRRQSYLHLTDKMRLECASSFFVRLAHSVSAYDELRGAQQGTRGNRTREQINSYHFCGVCPPHHFFYYPH